MLNRLKGRLQSAFAILAKPLVRARVDPNLITVFGLVSGMLAVCFYEIYPLMLLFVLLMALSDGLDGYVARALNKATSFGAFLDSTIDRAEDMLLIYLLYLVGAVNVPELAAMSTGAFLVSYTRSRAETLGVHMAGVGLAERAERLILTFVALAVYPLSAELAHAVCLILLLLIVVTVIQRILHVYRTLAGGST